MDNSIFKKVISYLLIASVFISGNGIAEIGFTFYWYYFLYIPFIIYGALVYHKMDLRIISTVLLLTVYSLITFQYGLPLVFKQIVGITFTLYVFYNFLLFENFNIEEIIRKYAMFSKLVLVIGFLQMFLFLLPFKNINGGDYYLYIFSFLQGTNITYRFQSVTQEPSYLAYTFSPIVFLSLRNLISKSPFIISRIWSILFLLAFVLTFSLVAYVGLLIMISIIIFRDLTVKKLTAAFMILLCIYILGNLIYNNIFFIRIKINETLEGISQDITKDRKYENYNYSTYALLTNWYVTKNSFNEHPFTGTGLGTYELTYDKILPEEIRNYFQLNRRDANSMGFRLLSETGVIGFLLFLFFLYRYRIRFIPNSLPDSEFLWVINSGILVMIILLIIRNGDYMSCGRILFLLLYFYTYVLFKNVRNKIGLPVL